MGEAITANVGSYEVYTIGHSTHELGEFIDVLKNFKIELVIDVRTIPRSRHNPQFNKDSLPKNLDLAGIGYVHMPGLGGLRHTQVDSVNRGWRNSSFRGYADYMQTASFEENLNELIAIVNKERSVIMCAESLPWRCHRSLISDALLVRRINVTHIMGAEKSIQHTLTSFAKVDGLRITYPGSKS